jgi:4-amino-4-deoxy-L-arabinose transferase-like glycosyltransferase
MHESREETVAGGRLLAWVLLFTLVGFAVRVAVQQREWTLATDSFQYMLLARSLAAGDGFLSGGGQHPDVSRAPLFPVLIAGATKLIGDVEAAANLVTALAGALVVIPLSLLAGDLFGRRAAYAAAPLGALSCVVAASARAMPTAPYALMCVAASLAAWRATKVSGLRWSAVAGSLAGLAALARTEGIVWPLALAGWLVFAPGRTARPGPWRRVATFLAVATAFYLPFVVFASARLGRFAPFPGIEYLQDIRKVTDHFGLRDGGRSDVPWSERARFIMTKDHSRLLLDDYFEHGRFGEPDPGQIGGGTAPEDGASPAGLPAIARRRAWIFLENFTHVPRYLYWTHFLTPALVGLGAVGTIVSVRRREHRIGLAFAAFVLLVSLTPVLSHLEPRFFYPPYALGLLVAAAGASALSSWGGAARWRRALSVAVTALVVALLARDGWRHPTGAATEPARERPLKELAALVRGKVPPGRMLAVQPAFPYLVGRPYLALPLGSPEEVLTFARANDACSLVLEGARDLKRRPELGALLTDPPPAGFHLLSASEHPEGGTLRVFAVETVGNGACHELDADTILPAGRTDANLR